MEAVSTEKVFFEAHGIKVTNARFIVNKQTYAMASVSSVKVSRTDKTPSKSAAILTTIVGAFVLAAAFGEIKQAWWAALVGLGLMGLGWLWAQSIKPLFEYKLILTTSSGETTALTSFSESDIRIVENALNESIIHRG